MNDVTPEQREELVSLLKFMRFYTFVERACLVCVGLSAFACGLAIYAGTPAWPSAVGAVAGAAGWGLAARLNEGARIAWLKACPCESCASFRRKHGL